VQPWTFITLLRADNSSCMPQKLPVGSGGQVSCTIFELPLSPASCDPTHGLSAVDPATEQAVDAAEHASSSQTVCQLAQLPTSDWVNGSCAQSTQPGWCYVTGAAAGNNCAQALRFSANGAPAAGVVALFACQ
jgi:hypothetical protein